MSSVPAVSGTEHARIIRCHLNAAQFLPAPDDPTRLRELKTHPELERDLPLFLSEDVIVPVEQKVDDEGDFPYQLWVTSRSAWPYLQQRLAQRTTYADVVDGGCPHTGFVNLAGESAPGYSCAEDTCDARYTEAEVREVVDGA